MKPLSFLVYHNFVLSPFLVCNLVSLSVCLYVSILIRSPLPALRGRNCCLLKAFRYQVSAISVHARPEALHVRPSTSQPSPSPVLGCFLVGTMQSAILFLLVA